MKRLTLVAALFAFAGLVSGCATPAPFGGIYYGAKLPVTATSNSAASKVGTSECNSVLGIVAFGDCTINSAKKNGGITKVSHVDWDASNILGIFGTYKVTVYGE